MSLIDELVKDAENIADNVVPDLREIPKLFTSLLARLENAVPQLAAPAPAAAPAPSPAAVEAASPVPSESAGTAEQAGAPSEAQAQEAVYAAEAALTAARTELATIEAAAHQGATPPTVESLPPEQSGGAS